MKSMMLIDDASLELRIKIIDLYSQAFPFWKGFFFIFASTELVSVSLSLKIKY